MKFWKNTRQEPSRKARLPEHFFREVDLEFMIHELKGPLAVVETGMKALLQKEDVYGPLSGKQKKTLKRTLKNTVKAREMIYGLLEIGRAETACYDCAPFYPAETLLAILIETLETVSSDLFEKIQLMDSNRAMLRLLEENGICVSYTEQAAVRQISQDRTKLKQIVGNLVRNALHYKQTTIWIRLDIDDDRLLLEIEDDGPGISPEDHATVFERYRQAKSGQQTDRSGHGLGLAGSYIITKRMGGDIDIIPRKKRGALFRVTLPVAFDPAGNESTIEKRGDTMADAQSPLKGKRILAVDDEADILETIADILEGVDLDTAGDYQSASDKISENRYDLAILDIMGVNGLKLLEEAVARGIPSVMLTAHAMSPDALMESIRKGAISYLPKESLADLESLLGVLLDAHDNGRPPWKLLFEKLGGFFDKRFGNGWKEENREFWSEFDRTYQVSRGIQERLKSQKNIIDKGI